MIDAMEYLNMSETDRAEYCRKVYIKELAETMSELDYYEGMTVESLAGDIERDPLEIIGDLLDIISDLQ